MSQSGLNYLMEQALAAQTQATIQQHKQNNNRQKRIIETSYQAKQAYNQARRGSRDETKELNINLKTINSQYLTTTLQQHELYPSGQSILSTYQNMPASFKSLQYLFSAPWPGPSAELHLSEDKIEKKDSKEPFRRLCLQLYRSWELPKKILGSTRMHIQNKLIMIKYLNQIEFTAISTSRTHRSWKQPKQSHLN